MEGRKYDGEREERGKQGEEGSTEEEKSIGVEGKKVSIV